MSKDTNKGCRRFIIDPSNYEIVTKISSGGFGSVYEVIRKDTGKKYAAKVINLDLNDTKNKQMVNREILIMIRCSHPTIIKLIGY